jgi:hypothetical protein
MRGVAAVASPVLVRQLLDSLVRWCEHGGWKFVAYQPTPIIDG